MIVRNQHLRNLEEFCSRDPARHAFCLWDLREERENTEFYVDWRGEVRGYMLIFTGGYYPSVIVQGSEESMGVFADMLPISKGIVHMPYEYMHIFPKGSAEYRIDVMVAQPKFYFHDPEVTVIKDVDKLVSLFQNPEYLVKKAITYGVVKDNRAVSVASALAHLPEVWVLGAVLTKKEFRNMGLATRVVGHLVSEAYGRTERIVLWVRSDNYTAIRIYRKYGFEKKWEEGWINYGVDIVP